MIPTTTPTADLRLSYTPDPASGTTIVDLDLSPHNDLMLVWGLDRLEQDVRRWLQVAPGDNPFDPTWGNPLWEELGRPQPVDPVSLFTTALAVAESTFLTAQQIAAAQGYLSTDEQLDRFEDVEVLLPPDQPGVVIVNMVLVARSGNDRPAQLWIPFGPPLRRIAPPTVVRPVLTALPGRLIPDQSSDVQLAYAGSETLTLSVPQGTLSRDVVQGLGVPTIFDLTYTAPSVVHSPQEVALSCAYSGGTTSVLLLLMPDQAPVLAWAVTSLVPGQGTTLLVTYGGRQTVTLSVTLGLLAQTTIVGTGRTVTTSIPYQAPALGGGDEFLPGSGFGAGVLPVTLPATVVATALDATDRVTASLPLLAPPPTMSASPSTVHSGQSSTITVLYAGGETLGLAVDVGTLSSSTVGGTGHVLATTVLYTAPLSVSSPAEATITLSWSGAPVSVVLALAP